LDQTQVLQENFEDTKGVIRSHQWKDRQENVQNLESWFFLGTSFMWIILLILLLLFIIFLY